MGQRLPLNPVNIVLNKVVSNLGLDRRLREHTFMSLWTTFVNGPLADRSRPLFIDADRNLVVSVADASTGQELSMQKGRLSEKVSSAARSLNIDVRGLRLDMKHFHQRSTVPEIPEPKPLPKPSEEELNAIVLTESDLAELGKLQADMQANSEANSALAAKVIALFERELRIRRWRFEHQFPLCPECGNPVERLLPPDRNSPHFNPERLPVCITCFYAD